MIQNEIRMLTREDGNYSPPKTIENNNLAKHKILSPSSSESCNDEPFDQPPPNVIALLIILTDKSLEKLN